MNVIKGLIRSKEIEKQEYKKDKRKGIPVRINPDSYAVKELEYQTALLQDIKHDLEEIKMLLHERK